MSGQPNTEAANVKDGEATSPTSSNTPSPTKQTKDKIDILLKATGDAPILKQKKWQVPKSKTIGSIIEFMKKLIKAEAADSLFIYVNQSFSPSPDIEVGTLYDCFGSDGKLILHYCKTQAWG